MARYSGKGFDMQHTPYGYDIISGKAVVNEEQVSNIHKICENYLGGMSFISAAADVGLSCWNSRGS